MTESRDQTDLNPLPSDPYDGLRQAILRLTSSHYESLQEEIEALRNQISAFEATWGQIENIQENLYHRDEELKQQNQELQALVEEAKLKLSNLETHFLEINKSLSDELRANAIQFKSDLASLREHLNSPQEVTNRTSPVLIPLISEGVLQKPDEFAEAVAPVIGPAIRHQIREAKQDIIDALYPLIGEIIGKAISEAFRELTRKIDTRLRRQLDFRSRMQLIFARLRGVSETELLMREELPYTIYHIFLIHRQTGLLLQHIPVSNEQVRDTDLISGMLTAIRDFVRDSFGREGDLEEVAYGQQRILLEGGNYAYLAVVLEGVEPEGYAKLMRDVIGDIHVHREAALRDFDGNMDQLPDFQEALSPLSTAATEGRKLGTHQEPIGRREKIFIVVGIIAILIACSILIFGCVFIIRLWPVAFASVLPTLTANPTPLPDPTSAASPILTLVNTMTPTAVPMYTVQSNPTSTTLPSPTNIVAQEYTVTPAPLVGILMGNLYLRSGPSTSHGSLAVLSKGELVIIVEKQGDWLHVQWPLQGETQLDGWIWSGLVEVTDSP